MMNLKWIIGVIAVAWSTPAFAQRVVCCQQKRVVCCPQVFCCPQVIYPRITYPRIVYPKTTYSKTYVHYILNIHQDIDSEKVWVDVNYDHIEWKRVPVICGYVPKFSTNGNRTTYDYRDCCTLESVIHKGSQPQVELKPYEPPVAPPAVSEFDGSEWNSGQKNVPAVDVEKPAAPKEPPFINPPPVENMTPIDPFKPSRGSDLPLDIQKGLRVPSDIKEPTKRIAPTYEENK